MSGNCDWALRYAETGIAIFPCTADSRKKPLVKWRTHSTTDGLIITEWWSAWPESMVGIDLHKCGLVVFDADGHSKDVDGVVALSELLQKHDTDLTQVPISRTPNNGLHFYFRQPDKLLGNREGDLPDGINVRGCGGFVIAPYCIRPDGKSYRGVPGHPDLITAFKTGIIPVLPAWLVDIIQAQSRRMPARSPAPAPIIKVSHDGRREAAYARAALTGCVNDLSPACRRTRDATLPLTAERTGWAGWWRAAGFLAMRSNNSCARLRPPVGLPPKTATAPSKPHCSPVSTLGSRSLILI